MSKIDQSLISGQMYAYFRELPQNHKAFLYKIKKVNITLKINFDLRLAFFDLFL